MIERLSDIARRLQPTYESAEARELALWLVEAAEKEEWSSEKLEEATLRLLRQEPIQYILGYTEWGGMRVKVTQDTLIPRPETWGLVERVSGFKFQVSSSKFKIQNSSFKILDIGTGSGCIALGVKKLQPEWDVMAVDIAEAALEVARENAKTNNLSIRTEQLDILDTQKTDEFIEQIGRFDVVVSNPPYICQSEAKEMTVNVLEHEPERALFVPDEDPLLFYRRIAELGWGKYLAFEINERLGAEVVALLEQLGYRDIQLEQDDYGKDRYVFARRD